LTPTRCPPDHGGLYPDVKFCEGFDLETLDELRSIEEDDITTGEGGRRAS
jgi:hypothetical protein